MEINKFKELNSLQGVFENEVSFLYKNFATDVYMKISTLKSARKNINNVDRINYYMEYSFEKKSNNKRLFFTIYDGLNAENNHVNEFDFFIEKNESERKIISYKDYCNFRKFKNNIKYIYSYENSSLLILNFELFVGNIKNILILPEIEHLLTSNEWIDIPIDMSPYK